MGICWEDGKENGNYHLRLKFKGNVQVRLTQ